MRKKIDDIKAIPKEQREKEIEMILKGGYPEEEEATIGENRGQLFVRIPRIITKRLDIKKGQKILFKIQNKKGKQKLDIEVIQ